jgi:hypothetical protein
MDNRELDMELRQHLDADEKLLWAGAPRQGVILRGSDAFMIPFSLLWGGFALFWEISVVGSGAPFFFMLWGIPFVLVGLYIIVGRFFYDSALRSSTVYGITPQRIIIKSGVFKKSIQSIYIGTLTNVTLNEKADGSGTIVLGPEFGIYGMFRGISMPASGNKMAPAFDMIDDARKVYRLIMDLQKQA